MANSMYNNGLKVIASDLQAFAKGEVHEVDLGGFKPLSAKAAEVYNAKYPNRKPRNLNGRGTWGDSAQVMTLEDGKPVTIGSINVHTLATGDVLGAFGFRGTFYITNGLKLVRTKLAEETKTANVTLAEIVAAGAE